MAVSKSAEKERLKKERIKKVGEKLLKEQMSSNTDVRKESQKLMSQDSPSSIKAQQSNVNEIQKRILNAEKNTKPMWNPDQSVWQKGIVFKSEKDKNKYQSDKNTIGEYKSGLATSINRSKTMKPIDYGLEAVANIKRERENELSFSSRLPKFKPNPTSRTETEKRREQSAKVTEKIGNKFFGANNPLSAWAAKGLEKVKKDVKNRQNQSYMDIKKDYSSNKSESGYEFGTGRPKSEKAKEYFGMMKKKKGMK